VDKEVKIPYHKGFGHVKVMGNQKKPVHARKLCEMKDLFFGCFLVASQIFRKK
jgi:hypothetical protein